MCLGPEPGVEDLVVLSLVLGVDDHLLVEGLASRLLGSGDLGANDLAGADGSQLLLCDAKGR